MEGSVITSYSIHYTKLYETVAEAIRSAPFLLPKEIVFVGFDLPADAALRQIFRVLQAQGVTVHIPVSRHAPAEAHLLRFPSFEDELQDAAAWCRDLLERGETDIGIIISHLDTVRTRTEYVFASVLHPARFPSEIAEIKPLFELSLGPRAADEPSIHAALMLLDMLRGSLELPQWTRILHTPFLRGSDRCGGRRAFLDAELRRRGSREASAKDILYVASAHDMLAGDPFLESYNFV